MAANAQDKRQEKCPVCGDDDNCGDCNHGGASVMFSVSGSTEYWVEPGASAPDVRPGGWGMLERIEILVGNQVTRAWESGHDLQLAESREQYDLIAAAADVAGIMLPDDDGDEQPPLIFGGN